MELRSENSTLKAHCAIAGTEIQDLRRRLNAKENRPRKRRKLNIDARWLNSDEGLRLAEEQEAFRVAEEQKKHKAREQRVAKEAEREEQRRQMDPNAPFTGALTSKTKADLQDIAQALELTTDGQKKIFWHESTLILMPILACVTNHALKAYSTGQEDGLLYELKLLNTRPRT